MNVSVVFCEWLDAYVKWIGWKILGKLFKNLSIEDLVLIWISKIRAKKVRKVCDFSDKVAIFVEEIRFNVNQGTI